MLLAHASDGHAPAYASKRSYSSLEIEHTTPQGDREERRLDIKPPAQGEHDQRMKRYRVAGIMTKPKQDIASKPVHERPLASRY